LSLAASAGRVPPGPLETNPIGQVGEPTLGGHYARVPHRSQAAHYKLCAASAFRRPLKLAGEGRQSLPTLPPATSPSSGLRVDAESRATTGPPLFGKRAGLLAGDERVLVGQGCRTQLAAGARLVVAVGLVCERQPHVRLVPAIAVA
jgi:hypothetical protein